MVSSDILLSTRLFNRDLVQWDGGDASDDGCILEDSIGQKNFDQFTGRKSSFKWETYTSRIDPEKSQYSVAEADKIASEIEADETKDIEDDTDSASKHASQVGMCFLFETHSMDHLSKCLEVYILDCACNDL